MPSDYVAIKPFIKCDPLSVQLLEEEEEEKEKIIVLRFMSSILSGILLLNVIICLFFSFSPNHVYPSAQRLIVHLTQSPENFGYVFSPGISQSDSLLHERARP